MYNKKNLAVIFLFCGIFLLVLVTALTAKRAAESGEIFAEKPSVENSYFKQVNFFKIKNQKRHSNLKASYLDVKDNQYFAFVQPQGYLHRGGQKIQYRADSGNLDGNLSHLKLSGQVEVKDQRSNYLSDRFEYDGQKEMMRASGKVRSEMIDPKTEDKLNIASQKMTSWLAEKKVSLVGGVKGQIQRRRQYEGKLKFESEELLLNQRDSYVKLDKRVKIRQNKMTLTAGNGEIFLENFNKKLKYYALYDDVRMEETLKLNSGVYQKRKAYAEKLESHQRSGKLILTGAPRVEQGSDTIKGYQITLREAVEMIEVDDSQSNFKLKREE